MNVDDGIEIIKKAYEKQAEERAFHLYTARYPWMSEKDFVPFSEFYKPQKTAEQNEIDNKSESEILSEVKEILDSFGKEVG